VFEKREIPIRVSDASATISHAEKSDFESSTSVHQCHIGCCAFLWTSIKSISIALNQTNHDIPYPEMEFMSLSADLFRPPRA
jgi:hypothetical protein